jgi:hypothetical protein
MKYHAYVVVLLLFVFCAAVSAQSVMFQELPGEKTKIRLRFLKPSFDNVDDLSFFSGVFDLQANVPVSPKWNVVLSMPYSTFSDGERTSRNSIGNLYIGAQAHGDLDSVHQTIGSFGLYLPTAPDDEDNANILAMYTNWHELHRYAPNTLTIYANVANIYHTTRGLFYGFEIGPNIWVPTGSDTENRDTEFLLHYGITGGVNVNQLIINAELVGLFFLSSDADSFSDKFYHSLVFNAQYTGWPVQPQLFYKLYLEEDLSDRVNGVLGLGLTFGVE